MSKGMTIIKYAATTMTVMKSYHGTDPIYGDAKRRWGKFETVTDEKWKKAWFAMYVVAEERILATWGVQSQST